MVVALQPIVVPSTLHAVQPPALSRSGLIAKSIQGRGNSLIVAHLRELSNQLKGLLLGDAMVLASGIARNAKLGMNTALPVQMHNVLVTLCILLDDDLVQHGAHDALLQFAGCGRMIP
jgi:hypothetical protein